MGWIRVLPRTPHRTRANDSTKGYARPTRSNLMPCPSHMGRSQQLLGADYQFSTYGSDRVGKAGKAGNAEFPWGFPKKEVRRAIRAQQLDCHSRSPTPVGRAPYPERVATCGVLCSRAHVGQRETLLLPPPGFTISLLYTPPTPTTYSATQGVSRLPLTVYPTNVGRYPNPKESRLSLTVYPKEHPDES